jgi:hypothetical protein
LTAVGIPETIAPKTAAPVTFASRAEALEVLERTFERVDRDGTLGPQLHAAGLRERLRLEDLDLTIEIAASGGDRCIDWSFETTEPFQARLTLTMDSEVANRVLQGAESIAVAIARGRIAIAGNAADALVHLPATRLIGAEYADLIAADYPHLVVRH